MTQEHELVPYSVSELPSGPWLIFAPHPDDETFGMGGSLLLASKEGIETHVIILTDGALGGNGANLVAVRKQEAQEAARCLGLTSMVFWNLPDRGLEANLGAIRKAANAIEGLNPASVFFPSPMEIHPDHRAAAHLAWEAIQRTTDVSVRAIAYEIGVQGQVNRLVDITEVRTEKANAMTCYQSQLKENKYIEIVEALNCARTYTLPSEVKAAEGFFCYDRSVRDLGLAVLSSLRSYWDPLELAQISDPRSVALNKRHQQLQADLHAVKNQLKQTSETLEAALELERNRYQTLVQSRSWKITEPLRAATRLWRTKISQRLFRKPL